MTERKNAEKPTSSPLEATELTKKNRSTCPIAVALDMLGDRWSLIVVRDLMMTKSLTYGELADCTEGITTNILADRLRKLSAEGIVKKTPYQTKPVRYEYSLTAKGLGLKPIMCAIVNWAHEHGGMSCEDMAKIFGSDSSGVCDEAPKAALTA